MYVVFQVLLIVGTLFFLLIAVGGIPILFYLLNGIRRSQPYAQETFFGMAINSLVAPYFVFLVVYVFNRYFGCGQKEMNIEENNLK